MGSDEVDARRGRAPGALIQIRAAGQARGDFRVKAHVALPELSYRVAIFAVPLHPTDRKVAHLIAAVAQVPGLRNQFGRSERRILIDGIEEGAELIDILELTGERGC